MRRVGLVAWLAVAGCTPTSLAPRTGTQVPVEDPDERGMWRLAFDAQARIDRSGHLLGDDALEQYLQEVARRLEPPEVFAAVPFRVRVIRNRVPNAFCLPNGAVYVHTGMLALIESEAELAAVLGHEMTHAVHRHALWLLHSTENRPAGLIFMISVGGYSRDLEREADREGVARMVSAGYDAREAPRLFERMRDWAVAEHVERPTAFYSSHPALTDRIESTTALAAARPAGGRVERESYALHTAPLLLDVARAELVSGRFPAARALAERFVKLRPEDARGHLALAEIARREDETGGRDAALAAYRRALELEPASAEAWRGLGLLLKRRGDASGAREALRRYLELAPGAQDRAMVAAEIDGLSGGTR